MGGAACRWVTAAVRGEDRVEPGRAWGAIRVDIRLLPDYARTVVVVGGIREDARICGDDATLLDPRGLNPATMTFHGATLQRLSPERRDAAVALTATPIEAMQTSRSLRSCAPPSRAPPSTRRRP